MYHYWQITIILFSTIFILDYFDFTVVCKSLASGYKNDVPLFCSLSTTHHCMLINGIILLNMP